MTAESDDAYLLWNDSPRPIAVLSDSKLPWAASSCINPCVLDEIVCVNAVFSGVTQGEAKMADTKVFPMVTRPRETSRFFRFQISGDDVMLKWALIFFIISLIAGVFGFTGIASGAAAMAKILFYIAVALFLLFLVLGVIAFKAVK